MALKRRCPDAGLLHHSDQGCTYASEDYQADPRGARHHLQHEPPRQLLRQRGDGELVLDLKSELGERFDSYGDAKMELFDYIEVFYNQRRRHSSLGQISPAAFERRATQAA